MMTIYPSESTLNRIRTFNPFEESIENFLDIIKSNWWMADYGWIRNSDYLELHTGGWSGNEDLIRAWQENQWGCWGNLWLKSERGGHHWFKIKDYFLAAPSNP